MTGAVAKSHELRIFSFAMPLDLRPVIDEIASQADDFLAGATTRAQARAGIAELINLDYFNLIPEDRKLVTDGVMATSRLEASFPSHTPPAEQFSADAAGRTYRVFLAQVDGAPADAEIGFHSIDQLLAEPATLAPSLAVLLVQLEPHLIDIPYLH